MSGEESEHWADREEHREKRWQTGMLVFQYAMFVAAIIFSYLSMRYMTRTGDGRPSSILAFLPFTGKKGSK